MLIAYLGGRQHQRWWIEEDAPAEKVMDGERYIRWADHPATVGLPYSKGNHVETYVLEGMTAEQIREALPVSLVVRRTL